MMLQIKELYKSFGQKNIFDNFSYDFCDKEIYALVGESGKGKTTLLRLICGLDNDYQGEISGGGIKNTSYAFQEPRLLPTINLIENIILANHDKIDKDNTEEARAMLLRLGFDEKDLYLFPNELSGGMKQRASLARAFLRKAPILLLDEPTKELDAENASIVKSIIKEEALVRTVIFVSHNESDILYFEPQIIKI